MIADGCNECALVGFRSGRCRRRALRLFHYHLSARGDEIEFTEQRENVGAQTSLNGASTNTKPKDSLQRPSSPVRDAPPSRRCARDQRIQALRDLRESRRRVARRIHKRHMRGAARERFDTQRSAARKNVEYADAVEIHPHREPRKDRLARPRRRGPRQQTARCLEPSAMSVSCNNSHRVNIFEALIGRINQRALIKPLKPLASKSRTIDNPFCRTPQVGGVLGNASLHLWRIGEIFATNH